MLVVVVVVVVVLSLTSFCTKVDTKGWNSAVVVGKIFMNVGVQRMLFTVSLHFVH